MTIPKINEIQMEELRNTNRWVTRSNCNNLCDEIDEL